MYDLRRKVMKQSILIAAVLFLLCSCAHQDKLDKAADLYKQGSRTLASTEPETYTARCGKMAITQVKTRQLYEDYYGTMITSDSSSLRGVRGYKWGITNSSPMNLAYFAAYVKPAGRFNYFRTYVYIDPEIRDTMVFQFRNNDNQGEVLKQLTIEPGQTKVVDIEITGVKRLYMGAELRINHAKATKMIFGEPEFYNCTR
jgi:hypothetical protein